MAARGFLAEIFEELTKEVTTQEVSLDSTFLKGLGAKKGL